MSFVSLHNHSQYSILDAMASVEEIAKTAASFHMPAVALTDHGNMFGAVDFFKACKEHAVKPIIGCEFYVAPDSRLEKKKDARGRSSYHLTLLAKDRQGYQNLCKLSSIGFLEGYYYHPRIDSETLKKHSDGLICLSGCLSGRLAQEIIHGTKDSTAEQLDWFQDVFKENYYLEMQRHQMREEDLQSDGMYLESWLYQQYQDYISKQAKVNERLVEIVKERNILLVATNDSHYIHREDWRSHEILLNIQSGEPCEIVEKDSYGNPKSRKPNPRRRTYPSHEIYFKSQDQMHKLFEDIPEAVANTLIVAEKCNLELDFKAKHYPVYLPPALENKENYTKEEQTKAVENFLWELCEKGIEKRYTKEKLDKVREIYPGKDPMQVIRERLSYEMNVIVPKGMCDYLLIVWDFIHWAKNNGIPMGPGRGSGAGSIVLYLIGVTDIEPLRFHLFFERFINPERISYPDIDVDICMDQRSRVIQYTLQKYGKECVAQIITFGTMKAKMTIKDVGRTLSVPLAKVNEIAKLVPEDLNITLEKALEKDPDLRTMYETDEETRRILDIGQKLEGSIRSTGLHAAGIIISGQALTDLIPVCVAKDSSMPVTQYSMKPVELVGMLKVDFLGLKTLTAIQMCVDGIKNSVKEEIDWVNLPLDDSLTFDLLNQGKTLGIFQLESGGMQDLARHLHLDKFEEIIAVGALYRPGPMDMIPSFINRKHKREPIENDHPWMTDILAETYGIMVYQEQVMQIASRLAGFSLGEGDVLRRAMGKKDSKEMAKQREKFRIGALKNDIDEATSMHIFDKMEKFAAYGFNKSHAAAYGYLSYVTAYLKAHYPKEWLAALMTCDFSDLSKVTKFIKEAQSMNIPVLPPDINESSLAFVATPLGIRFAMAGIKGVGTGVVESIIEEKKRGGPFKSLYDFFKRIDTSKVGKKVVENLVDAGCFDFTGWSRDGLKMGIEPMFEAAVKEKKDMAGGVLSLFSLLGDQESDRFSKEPVVKSPRTHLELLLKEKELLGLFLIGHPMDDYKDILSRLSAVELSMLEEMDHDAVCRTAFIVESVQVKISAKTQKKFAILLISDGVETYELPIWSDLYEEKQYLLRENQLLYAVLQVDKKSDVTRFSCRWLDDLTVADEKMVEACDAAYDKAKAKSFQFAKARQAKTQGLAKEPGEQTNEKKMKAETTLVKTLFLNVEADQATLGGLLRLKKILSRYPGQSPVTLSFQSGGRQVGLVQIDEKFGVHISKELEEELESLHPAIAGVNK